MIFNKVPKRETLILALGEALVAVLICLGYLLIGKFEWQVATGAVLGGAVTVLNFLFLAISVNRALDRIIAEGIDKDKLNKSLEDLYEKSESDKTVSGETDVIGEDTDGEASESDTHDDAAARFANENAGKLQNAVKLSFIIRSASMVAALVLAFLTGWFDVIATVIPLFMQRPILTVSEMLRKEEK
ncbi:MAG: hypothetical protein E7617_04085 [Ruminococcaceae bacterium]|nr:hypothetical protein [Oscillospiraceae bacterium]